jgi:ubiquinone/menaquinone biosynthesis C-methylase UbiE
MSISETVYPRGKVAGVYPALDSRREEAYVDFIEDARNFLLHAQQLPIRNYSVGLLQQAGLSQKPDPESTRRSIDLLMQDPVLKTYYRLKRSLQESFWNSLLRAYGGRREALLAALDEAERKGPGTVSWDPAWTPPDYSTVEIHLQPGGYSREPLAGFMYDFGLKVFMGGAADRDFVAHMAAKAAGVPPDGKVRRILDLGCSAGATTTALKLAHPGAEVTGIDVSAPMLRYAHLRAVEQGIEVHFRQMAAEQLTYPDGQFDMVLAMLLFHEVPTAVGRRIVEEAFRVLRPGGTFTILDFSGDRERDVYSMFFAEMDAADNGEPYLPGYVRSNVEDVMREAGFEMLRPYDHRQALTAGRVGVKP